MPSNVRPPKPSGPPARFFMGFLPEFRRDPLRYLLQYAATYGDVVKLRYGIAGDLLKRRRGSYALLLGHPDDIKHVLATHQRNYSKMIFPEAERMVFGKGLLISAEPLHLRQRRIIQPAFHRQHIASYGAMMIEKTEQRLKNWESGATVDVAVEMMRLTLSIICKTLFSVELEDKVREISEAITVGQHHITYQYRHFAAPAFVPTRRNRRFKASHTRLNALIFGIIRSRREETNPPEDLLTLLLEARYEEGGGMDDRQIRDELITLFLAGHETTANALAWTWYLLSTHPEVEERLEAELRQVLGGRAPSPDDLPNLPYTEQVFAEAMRIYPPAWILHTRTALSDDQLPTGAFVPSGMDVLISPYLVHHDPRFFPDPDRFDPERFSPDARQKLPPFAYFPFGGGSRMCIGESFAKMEGILLLAAIAQRFKMALAPDQVIEPEPLVTLRPRNGVRMQLNRREGGGD